MKKLAVCLMLVTAFMMAVPASAQFRFGIKAGANISKMSFSTDILKSDNITSFTGGVMAEFMVPVVGFGVDASLMYTRKGSKINLGTLTDAAEEAFGHKTQHLDYIDIPINLKYKLGIPAVGNIVKPYIYAGPSFGVLVGNNIKEQYKEKDFDLTINLGLGLELFKKVQVAAQYGWGVTEAVKYPSINEVKAKNRSWTITAAYLF